MLYQSISARPALSSKCKQRQADLQLNIAAPDATKLSRLRRVRFGSANWIPDNSRNRAEIDRYQLPAGRTAANPGGQMMGRTDNTDAWTPGRLTVK